MIHASSQVGMALSSLSRASPTPTRIPFSGLTQCHHQRSALSLLQLVWESFSGHPPPFSGTSRFRAPLGASPRLRVHLRVCERMGGDLRDSGFAMRRILRTRGLEPMRNSEFVLRDGFLHSP